VTVLGPNTRASDAQGRSLAAAFVRAADRYGDRPAVIEGERVLTYADLRRLAEAAATGLRSIGVRRGDRVLVVLPRGADFIASIVGVTMAGGVYVPADPSWPEERLERLREIVAPLATIADSPVRSARSVFRPADLFDLGTRVGSVVDSATVGPEDACYIMFTSGTTGEPKGVVIPHRAVLRLVCDQDFAEIEPGRVWLQLASTSFDASTLEVWGPLLNGGCSVTVPDQQPSLHTIAELIGTERITDVWLTSSLFNAMVDHAPHAFENVQQVLTGGERLSPAHVSRFLEIWPGTRLINGYGPTENTTFTCCHTISVDDVRNLDEIPIGRPIRGTDVRIVGDDGRSVRPGESGELLAGGLGVALGYLNDEELTSRRFVRFPDSPSLWYRTGDVVRQRTDGVIEFLGRIDRQVKVRGYRVELEEVERQIAAHPSVEAAFAMVIGDRSDQNRLAAGYTTRDPSASPGGREVKAWLEERVPAYVVPDVLRPLESTPIGPNGKADYKAIERLLVSESHSAPASTDDPDPAPLGLSWVRLAEAIREVIPGSHPTPDSGFVEIGGQSIAALRVSASLRESLHVDVAAGDILGAVTLGELVDKIHGSGESATPDQRATEKDGGIRATSIQEQLYFESGLDPTGSAYHEYAAFAAGPGLDLDALERAWAALIDRHEVLRTRLELSDDALVQRVDPPGSMEPDVRRVPRKVSWESGAVPIAVLDEISAPFDLASEHPARLRVFELDGGGSAVVAIFHHVAVDEWSLGIIGRELSALYSHDRPLSRPVPFRVYAEHELSQRSVVRIDRLSRVLFASMRADSVSTRVPAPGVCHSLSIDGLSVPELTDRAKQEGCTVPAFLLGAFADALCQTLGRRTVVVLTPLSHRTGRTLQDVVGCCNSMLPVGFEPAAESAVLSARRQLIEAYTGGIAPFTDVVRSLPSRSRHTAGVVDFGFAARTLPAFCPTLPRVDTRPLSCPNSAARFPLGVSFDLAGTSVTATLNAAARSDLAECLPVLSETLEAFLKGEDSPVRVVSAAPSAVPISRQPTPAASLDEEVLGVVRRVWESLTGAPAGPDRNFFDVGGHSMLLLRMAARLRHETGLELPLNEFLQDPTFGRLVSCLAERLTDSSEREPFLIEDFGRAERVIVCIPGAVGRPIMFSRLADDLRALTDGAVGLRAYNLYDAIQTHGPNHAIELILDELDSDLQDPRVAGVLGFSLGGWFPLLLGDRQASIGADKMLWMLDVFPPSILEERRHRWSLTLRNARSDPRRALQAARDTVSLLFRSVRASITNEVDPPGLDPETEERVHNAFRRRPMAAWRASATILASERRPIWHPYVDRRAMNGLLPFLAGPTRQVSFGEWHGDLLMTHSLEIARVLCEDLGVPNEVRS
jgi:amino acid adenylation domain-containing protein